MLILTNAVTIRAAIGAIQIIPYNNMVGTMRKASRGSGIVSFLLAPCSCSAGSPLRKTLEPEPAPEPKAVPDEAGETPHSTPGDGARSLLGPAPIKTRVSGSSAAAAIRRRCFGPEPLIYRLPGGCPGWVLRESM